jgi:hypothetical protein
MLSHFHRQETKMARHSRPGMEMSAEADRALLRVTTLAHRLAAGLAGEELPENGRVETPGAATLAMGMFSFLFSIEPGDLHAIFFAEGSMKRFAFSPLPPEAAIPPLFAGLRPYERSLAG